MPTYLTEFLVTITAPIATLLAAWALAEVIRLIRSRVRNEHLRGALERAAQAVATATAATAQAFVADLKDPTKPGAWTPERASEALEMTLDDAREFMGPKGLAELRAILGSDEGAVDRWLAAMIEARIAAAKAGTP